VTASIREGRTRFHVGVTTAKWGARAWSLGTRRMVTWPLVDLEVDRETITLRARSGYSALVVRFIGLAYLEDVSDPNDRRVLWRANKHDVQIHAVRPVGFTIVRASDLSRVTVDTPITSQVPMMLALIAPEHFDEATL